MWDFDVVDEMVHPFPQCGQLALSTRRSTLQPGPNGLHTGRVVALLESLMLVEGVCVVQPWHPLSGSCWFDEYDLDYGVPTAGMRMLAPGVYSRERSHVTVQLDCNTFVAAFKWKRR